jgi:hypothetical protein
VARGVRCDKVVGGIGRRRRWVVRGGSMKGWRGEEGGGVTESESAREDMSFFVER